MRWVTVGAGAGVGIAVHELGAGAGASPPARTDLVAVHAAGLHGHVWGPLVEHLPERFRTLAVDVRGHGASEPLPAGGSGWEELASDLLAVVDALELHRPLGVGHSAGASLLLLAEEQRPGTFAGLCCLEPIGSVVEDPPEADPGRPLAEGARRRRQVFASRQEAFDTYAAKPPFSEVAPEALWAYVDHGFSEITEGEGAGVQLRCRPEDEAAMYAHGLSHHAYRDLDRVRCPVALLGGERSSAVPAEVLGAWAARLPDARVRVLPGLGHFAPLEDPAGVARAVADAFERG